MPARCAAPLRLSLLRATHAMRTQANTGCRCSRASSSSSTCRVRALAAFCLQHASCLRHALTCRACCACRACRACRAPQSLTWCVCVMDIAARLRALRFALCALRFTYSALYPFAFLQFNLMYDTGAYALWISRHACAFADLRAIHSATLQITTLPIRRPSCPSSKNSKRARWRSSRRCLPAPASSRPPAWCTACRARRPGRS